jgi:hypothetical protein
MCVKSLPRQLVDTMKYVLGMCLAAVSATAAFAEGQCKIGKPDVFKFISWDIKQVSTDIISINLTFHNTLDRTLITASFGAAVNDKDGKPIDNISFHMEEDAKALGDHTETFEYQGMQADVVQRLQGTTPVLCLWMAIDDKNQDLNYLTQ